MKDWVKQDGFPLIVAERDGNKVKLTQSRFSFSRSAKSEQKWVIPLHVSTSTEKDKHIVMDGATASFDVLPNTTWILINSGQGAFVTVLYQGKDFAASVLKVKK